MMIISYHSVTEYHYCVLLGHYYIISYHIRVSLLCAVVLYSSTPLPINIHCTCCSLFLNTIAYQYTLYLLFSIPQHHCLSIYIVPVVLYSSTPLPINIHCTCCSLFLNTIAYQYTLYLLFSIPQHHCLSIYIVPLRTYRARCALNKKILNLLNKESVSGESSGRAGL